MMRQYSYRLRFTLGSLALFALLLSPCALRAEESPVSLPSPEPSASSSPAAVPVVQDLRAPSADPAAVAADLELILAQAALPSGLIQLGQLETVSESASGNQVSFRCTSDGNGGGTVFLDVAASAEEWSATAYYGLQKLGFLFPHPRRQISPADPASVLSHCGESAVWDPRFPIRGFHLHTQHPNEWMQGFLMGKTEIANDTVRWLARNGQNVFQIFLLRGIPLQTLSAYLAPPYALAHSLGVLCGANVSFDEVQQRAYRLLPLITISIFGNSEVKEIRQAIDQLVSAIQFDFLSSDIGESEYTPGNAQKTLSWIDAARSELESKGKRFFVKVHVSDPTADPDRNFNFIPRLSAPSVGVLTHTVMYYGFADQSTPVYGRKNFDDIFAFLGEQAPQRPTWYFPETSYWIGMDLDVPLFLTDYLKARSSDMDLIEQAHAGGQIDFTSGQELGYWLMDWTVALLAQRSNAGNPLVGLELLGEDPGVWGKILDYQTRYIKTPGLLGMISSENIMDTAFPWLHMQVHARFTFAELQSNPGELDSEIALLSDAVANAPSLDGVKDPELKGLLAVMQDRISFSLYLRQAMAVDVNHEAPDLRSLYLSQAEWFHMQAQLQMDAIVLASARYPEIPIFARAGNPTSYGYGYLWPAATLRWWRDEEDRVKTKNYGLLDLELDDPLAILNPF